VTLTKPHSSAGAALLKYELSYFPVTGKVDQILTKRVQVLLSFVI